MIVNPHKSDEHLTDEKVGELLVMRRKFHRAMIEGHHPLCKEIRCLRRLLDPLMRTNKRSYVFWDSCPYVLSLFSLQCTLKEDIAQRRRIASLVEPSVVLGEDKHEDGHESTADAISVRVPRVTAACCDQLLIDHDVSEEASVYISWAGVVLRADEQKTLDVICDEILALEVRLQIGWTMLHYVNTWKHLALDSSKPLRGAFELRWQMARMIETTEDLIDASISSRLKKIYAELIFTSGFENEKRKAERGLDAATEYAAMVSERAEHKYRIIVEILLFLFGFCQVIPLVFEVPFVKLPMWILWPFLLVAVALVIVRYSKLTR